MATRKKKAALLRKFRDSGFTFHVYENETQVLKGRREIGAIVGMKEASGRHCFRLAADTRKKPRTYRGRIQAAEALLEIDDLVRAAKKYRWSPAELVIRAWDGKPRASRQ